MNECRQVCSFVACGGSVDEAAPAQVPHLHDFAIDSGAPLPALQAPEKLTAPASTAAPQVLVQRSHACLAPAAPQVG